MSTEQELRRQLAQAKEALTSISDLAGEFDKPPDADDAMTSLDAVTTVGAIRTIANSALEDLD
jgi:hypothetical protein